VTAAAILMMAGGREVTRTVLMDGPVADTAAQTLAQPVMAGAGLKAMAGPMVLAPGMRAAGAVAALAAGIVLAAPAAGFLATIDETPLFTIGNCVRKSWMPAFAGMTAVTPQNYP
jgi:hypothetical protein